MITEKMLIAAAEEVSAAMAVSVPEESHVFSGAFEKKLRRLIHRAEHPILHQVRRCAVAAVLTLILAFGAVCAVSPTARAAVVGWMRTTVGSWFRYAAVETAPQDVQYEYSLPDVIAGYSLLTKIDQENGSTYIYVNDWGKMLQFVYATGQTQIFLDVEHCTYEQGFVDLYAADIYISPNQERNSAIVWQDADHNMICYICVIAEKAELIEIAETIESYKKLLN